MNGREALIKAAWLVWRNYPPAKDWGRELLKRWLAWHMGESFLIFILDDEFNQKIVGLVIARPVMNPQDAVNDCYAFDQEGSCLYIDLAISKHPDTLVAGGFAVLDRFGMREKIAWQKYEQLFCYSAATFRRNLLRQQLARK